MSDERVTEYVSRDSGWYTLGISALGAVFALGGAWAAFGKDIQSNSKDIAFITTSLAVMQQNRIDQAVANAEREAMGKGILANQESIKQILGILMDQRRNSATAKPSSETETG